MVTLQGKRSVEKEAEEEQFRDILLLMELLNNLLSKDFIDLAPQGNFLKNLLIGSL
jgi:hypothetical protein